jgi:hypothetical protein
LGPHGCRLGPKQQLDISAAPNGRSKVQRFNVREQSFGRQQIQLLRYVQIVCNVGLDGEMFNQRQLRDASSWKREV